MFNIRLLRKVFLILVSFFILINLIQIRIPSCDRVINFKQEEDDSWVHQEAENKEWEKVNDIFYVRRSAVVYLYDDATVKLVAVADKDFLTSPIFNLKIKNSLFNKYFELNTTKFYSEKVHWYQNFPYNEYSISFHLQLEFIEYFKNPKEILIQMIIFDLKRNLRTKSPINVQIKSKKFSKNRGTAVCCKNYILTINEFDKFRWWIELNRHFGYKKIMILNASIPEEKFKHYLKENKDFIEVESYHYYPHMNHNKTVLELKGYQAVRHRNLARIHESIALNECFLRLFAEYDRVVVYDLDEIVMPVTESQRISQTDIKDTLITNAQECHVDIESYYSMLKAQSSRKYLVMRFLYRILIENFFADSIFASLSRIIRHQDHFIKPIIFFVLYPPTKVNICFSIQNDEQFKYAKSLLYIYELYSRDSKILEKYNTSFNRFFMLEKNFNVKSAYELEEHKVIGHHRLYGPFLDNEWTVPFNKGSTTHFRDKLNIEIYFRHEINFTIKELKYDIFYFNCVLLKIDRILNKS